MSYKTGWGFKPPVASSRTSASSSSSSSSTHPSASPPRPPAPRPPPPRSSFSVTLEEGSDDEEEEEVEQNHHHDPTPSTPVASYDDDKQQQQAWQRQQPPPYRPSSSSSSSTAMVPAGGGGGGQQPLGFTVDLDREFGGEYHNLWPYRTLNSVQSSFWAVCFNTDRNVVIAAPTGVGKTMALEAAICRLLQESESVGDMHRKWKVVYIAPVKALCQQRLLDWRGRFGSRFGLKCAELTGDSAGLREVAASQILFTTPEKFDAVSRDWRENLYLLGSVRLVLIDEAHFLGEDPRGSALEALICRLKVIKTHKGIVEKGLPASKMRMIAVSATLPNVEDMGTWLEAPTEAVFNFDYTFRPVPLEVHVLGYANASNPFLFQRTLESRAMDVISKYSEGGKATLVFCGSKKGAETLAGKLADTALVLTSGNGGGGRGRGQGGGRQQQQEQAERFSALQNHKLKELMLSCGGAVAFHHAGLSAEDRACVEGLFQQGVVRVLCSTSTLAQGINSPAFLAIILGTTFWRGAGTGYEDLPVSAVLQMIGRAGRPGYDDRGVAVIMTSKDKELAYTSMAEGQEVVESQLPARFHEALNAEVCSNVISNLDDAMRWLRSTFLWVRAHHNPRHYAALLPRDTSSPDADNSVGGRLKAYMLRTLAELEAEEVLRLGEPAVDVDAMPDSAAQESKTVVPMVAGRVMSKTMVSFETIKILRALPFDASLEDLLYACSRCPEVCSPVRKAEKRPLNDLLKRVRFSKGLGIKRCTLPPHKAFVLVQACLGNLEITDFTLKLEAETIMDNVARIVRANQQLCVDTGRGGGAYLSLLLGRSLRARMWETEREALLLRQVEGIGAAFCQKLGLAGINTFQDLVNALPSKIEAACHRRHPWGLELIQLVAGILDSSLSMHVSQVEGKPGTRGDVATLVVKLTRGSTSGAGNSGIDTGGLESGLTGGQGRKKWWLNSTLVAFSSGPDRNLLLFREIPFSSSSGSGGEGEEETVHRIEFSVPSPIKLEGGEGGDKRFRTTLALVSPFISLDCLQIFYPSFGEDGAGGGGAPRKRSGMVASTPSFSSSSSRRTTASTRSTTTAMTPAADNKYQPAAAPPKKAKAGAAAAAAAAAAASTPAAASAISDDRPGTLPAHFQHQRERQERREQELRARREKEVTERKEELAREQQQRRRQEQQQQQQQQQQHESDRWVQDAAATAAAAEEAELLRRALEKAEAQQKQQELREEWHRQQEQKQQQWEWENRQRQQQEQAHQRQQQEAQQYQYQQQQHHQRQAASTTSNTWRSSSVPPPPTSGRPLDAAPTTTPVRRANDPFSSFQFAPSQRSPILDLTENNGSSDNPPSSSISSAESFRRRYPGSSSTGISPPQPLPPPPPPSRSSQMASSSAMDSAGEFELSLLHAKAREAHADQVPIHRIPKAAPTNPPPVIISDTGPLLSRKVVGSSSRADTMPAAAGAAATSKFFRRTSTSPAQGQQLQPPLQPQAATSRFGALYQSSKAPPPERMMQQQQQQQQQDLLRSKRGRSQDDYGGGNDDEDENDDLTLPSLPASYGSPPSLGMPPPHYPDKRPFQHRAPLPPPPPPASSAYYPGEQQYSYNPNPPPSQAVPPAFQQQQYDAYLPQDYNGGGGAAAGVGLEQQPAEMPSDSFDSAGFF